MSNQIVGDISDRTADSFGDPSNHTAGIDALSTSTESRESQRVNNGMDPKKYWQSPLESPLSGSNWVDDHINRARVIERYGEALKKFDWLVYLIASFALIIISIITSHYYGTSAAITSICTALTTGALSLIKRKTG